jgi:hypothetical protein
MLAPAMDTCNLATVALGRQPACGGGPAKGVGKQGLGAFKLICPRPNLPWMEYCGSTSRIGFFLLLAKCRGVWLLTLHRIGAIMADQSMSQQQPRRRRGLHGYKVLLPANT